MVICLEIGSRQRAPLRCLRLAWYGILGDGAESWMGGGNRMQQWLDMNIWQIMKDWNETGRRKTIVAMNFQPFFCLNQLTTLRIGAPIFSQMNSHFAKGKTPLGSTKSFHVVGLTGCNLQLRCTDMAKSYAWYLWHWSNVPKHHHGGQGRWRNGRVFGVLLFFSFFHGLILNT